MMPSIGTELASDNLAQKWESKTPVATRALTACVPSGKFAIWIAHRPLWSQWSANTELVIRALIGFMHDECCLQCVMPAVLSESWREERYQAESSVTLCAWRGTPWCLHCLWFSPWEAKREETVELSQPGYQIPFPFIRSLSLLVFMSFFLILLFNRNGSLERR